MADLSSCSDNVRRLWDRMNPCMLCSRNCRVNRHAGQTGFCGIGAEPVVSSVTPHFGEESVLVGPGGSGTIFFAGSNLRCVFCQNYDISQYRPCYQGAQYPEINRRPTRDEITRPRQHAIQKGLNVL
jgi:uncharacterized Fe-S radical SAM superfamily protein PflX